MADMTAETVAKMLISGWIAYFGTPLKITTNLGRKFQSSIFGELNKMLGVRHRINASNHHTNDKPFVQKSLSNSAHVFLRIDVIRTPLQKPYNGSYEVIKRFEKYFIIKIQDRLSKISIDRLKAAYISYTMVLIDQQQQQLNIY